MLPLDRYELCRRLGLDHERSWWFMLHPDHARLLFSVLIEMRSK